MCFRTGTPLGPQAARPHPSWGRGRGLQRGETPALGHLPSPLPAPQIKSDKQQLGSVIYSIQGPGVDEEPQGVFSIDKFTGKVSLNAMLDRKSVV